MQEFYPRQPTLLGMNVGGGGGGTREILLRLRRAGRPGSFLPYDSVLRTMLHELCHNHHGPHAAPFYKLLDELTAECEDLLAKGVGGSGSGFDAPAAGRVGGRNAGRQLSSFDRREAALRAAETRAVLQAIMSAGPRRLGGGATPAGATPAEAAAAAAERRARDNRWCPTEAVGQAVEERGGTDGAIHAILDAAYGVGGAEGAGEGNEATTAALKQRATAAAAGGGSAKAGPSGAGRKRGRAVSDAAERVEMEGVVIDLTGDASPLPPPPPPQRRSARNSGSGEWACLTCTFLNPKLMALQCDVCGAPRPMGSVAAAAAGGSGRI